MRSVQGDPRAEAILVFVDQAFEMDYFSYYLRNSKKRKQISNCRIQGSLRKIPCFPNSRISGSTGTVPEGAGRAAGFIAFKGVDGKGDFILNVTGACHVIHERKTSQDAIQLRREQVDDKDNFIFVQGNSLYTHVLVPYYIINIYNVELHWILHG